jgi:DNA repair exonuclease SbcCD ATPase subunit
MADTAPRNPTKAEELKELAELLSNGDIDQDDFDFMKKQIMGKEDKPKKSKLDELEDTEKNIKRYIKMGGRWLMYAGIFITAVIILGKGGCSMCSGPKKPRNLEEQKKALQEQIDQIRQSSEEQSEVYELQKELQKEQQKKRTEEQQKQKKEKITELNGGAEKVKAKTDKYPELIELRDTDRGAFERRLLEMTPAEKALWKQWKNENGYR